MKSLIIALGLLCAGSLSDAYSTYQRSSSMTSSSSSSSSSSGGGCCTLSPWAYTHIDDVRQMADRLRQEYNARSRGQLSGQHTNRAWSENFASSIGKTNEEIDTISRQLCDKIIADMRSGRVSYGLVVKPNYFEAQAATALEKLTEDAEYIDNQQQQVDLYEPQVPHIEATDLSKFDQVQHMNYPTEVKVVNGQTSQLNTIQKNNQQVFQRQESDRLNSILLQHNTTVDQLQDQIRRDQERYKDLARQYKLNVEDMEKVFKNELKRLTDVISQQQLEMKRITEWQRLERTRLEDVIRHHNLTVDELEQKIKHVRSYLQGLAHISLEELEKWQRSELDRLHETGKDNLRNELQVWQQQERDRMLAIIKKNDLTIDEYESKIGNDRARLQQLATMYQVQVEEIEKWLRESSQKFSEILPCGSSKNVIVSRRSCQGLVKIEDLQDWQKTEREKLVRLAQDNKLTVEDFEQRLLSDKNRLQQLATQYHVELKDIETWLRKESDRLQSLGLKLQKTRKVQNDGEVKYKTCHLSS